MKLPNDLEGHDRKPEDAGQGTPDQPGSATGMFQQPLASPVESSVDDLMGDVRGRAARESDAPLTPAAGGPSNEAPAADRPTSPLEQRAPVEQKASSGEFTQFFRGMAPAAGPEALAPVRTPAPSPPAGEDAAGDFTRIFSRLPKAPEVQLREAQLPKAEPRSAPGNTPAPEDKQEAEPGEFTRLMRSVSAEEGPKKREVPGDDRLDRAAPPAAPIRGFSAPGVSDAVSGTAGVTGFFAAPAGKPPPSSSSDSFADKAVPAKQESGSSDRSSEAFFRSLDHSDDLQRSGDRSARQEPSAGGFTQLFRSLDEREGAPKANAPLDARSPAASPVRQQAGEGLDAKPGEFTRLMQSLSKESSGDAPAGEKPLTGVRPVPAASPSQPPAQASTGPGDFTRIISSSMLREEAVMREEAANAPKPARPTAERPPAPPPVPPPSIPRPPSFAFGAPPAGAAPTPAAPQVPMPAPPSQSKLQAYLPVLLVINAFVLAVLILLVLFALRHH
ncbi:MAG: hypothetical protein ACR2JE_17525 [Acidobacteriaceae bacterium]